MVAVSGISLVVLVAAIAAVAVVRSDDEMPDEPLVTWSGSRDFSVMNNEAWLIESVWEDRPTIVSRDVNGAEIMLAVPIANDSSVDIEVLDPHPDLEAAAVDKCFWMPIEVVFFEDDQGLGDASTAKMTPPFTFRAGATAYIEVTGVLNYRGDRKCFEGGGSIQEAEVELPYRVSGTTTTATLDLGHTIAYFDNPEDRIHQEITHLNAPE